VGKSKLQQSNLCKKKNGFYGKHHTKETKEKLRQIQLDKTSLQPNEGKLSEEITKDIPNKKLSPLQLDSIRRCKAMEKFTRFI
jgi:hypothetical protein